MPDHRDPAGDTAWLAGSPAWLPGVARSPEGAVAGLILAFFLFHVALAASLGLGVDECYGIGVSHDLQLSYFDHAPLHYWITHFSIPFLGDGRALRLPFVVIFAGTSWAMYLLTRQLFGAAAGFWAVLSLNLSGFFTLAGGWVVPDGPLMLCLVAAAYVIARDLFPKADLARPSPWRTWIAAGFWLGLAGLSKYHAGLFVLGLLIYFGSVPSRRVVLLHPAPWLGAALALVMITPVLVWNAEHHWVSFAYQFGRATGYGSFPKIRQFLEILGAQFLWLVPWIIIPMIAAIHGALRRGRGDERSWYCLCLGLPTVLIFTLVPLWGDRGLPHWQMPGWLLLFPLLGDYIVRDVGLLIRPRSWAIASAALLVGLAVVLVGHAQTGYGRLLFPAAFAQGDPTLESLEWTPLREELQRRGLLPKTELSKTELSKTKLFVISGSPIDIGKIDQALNDAVPMLVFGESKQYAFRYDPRRFVGWDALLIGRRDRMVGVDTSLAPYFASIEELPPFVFGRSGMREVDVRILYAHDLKRPLPSRYESPSD